MVETQHKEKKFTRKQILAYHDIPDSNLNCTLYLSIFLFLPLCGPSRGRGCTGSGWCNEFGKINNSELGSACFPECEDISIYLFPWGRGWKTRKKRKGHRWYLSQWNIDDSGNARSSFSVREQVGRLRITLVHSRIWWIEDVREFLSREKTLVWRSSDARQSSLKLSFFLRALNEVSVSLCAMTMMLILLVKVLQHLLVGFGLVRCAVKHSSCQRNSRVRKNGSQVRSEQKPQAWGARFETNIPMAHQCWILDFLSGL